MSVEKMTMFTISGPVAMVDTAIQRFVVNRDVQPENAIKAMERQKRLQPFDTVSPYSEPLAHAKGLLASMGISPDYADFTNEKFDIGGVTAYLSELTGKIGSLTDERLRCGNLISNNTVVVEQLSHFSGIDVDLDVLFGMHYARFRYGRLPISMEPEFNAKLGGRDDVFFIPSSRTERWIYGTYFVLPADYAHVDQLFNAIGFERIRIDLTSGSKMTAEELSAELNADKKNAKDRLGQIEKELAAVKTAESAKLLRVYSWLMFTDKAYSLRALAGQRHDIFYIVGWIPSPRAEKFAAECESVESIACVLTEPRDKEDSNPPVKLTKSFLRGIFDPYVEMYGLPKYGEIDPRLFMAVTYTVLFGIMFGDVGQGACLILGGFLLWKLKGMWLGRILCLCGFSSVAFGFVYGSVFGNENWLPGFKVLEDGNTMNILLISVAIGVLLLLFCMILNIITGVRQRDLKKILFSANGVAGFVLYAGLVIGLALNLMFGINIMTTAYIIFVVVVPLLLILCGEPLSKLLTGRRDWKPESLGMFFVQGFFELFETLLSYVSNTISFLRVGAYAISHAGMMMVVYMLSGANQGDPSIFGLIIGNLLIMALEAALTSIQLMRLEFYEMFGRFYAGGGHKFTPVNVDYKAA